jgi:hypothetical protein
MFAATDRGAGGGNQSQDRALARRTIWKPLGQKECTQKMAESVYLIDFAREFPLA